MSAPESIRSWRSFAFAFSACSRFSARSAALASFAFFWSAAFFAAAFYFLVLVSLGTGFSYV
jgi:hypothetical protein